MQLLSVRIATVSSKLAKRYNDASEDRLVPLGRLVKTHGVRGQLRFFPNAFPCLTLREGVAVSLKGKDGMVRLLTVESVRPQAPFLLIRFQDITSLEQAQELRDAIVFAAEEMLPPLEEGEFYYYQVVGLQVFTTSEEPIGVIAQVFFSGGHDVSVVRHGKKEYMIPVTDEVVRSIDIPGGRVVIEPLEGLLD
jgi:16S rRNA processing protein RimM